MVVVAEQIAYRTNQDPQNRTSQSLQNELLNDRIGFQVLRESIRPCNLLSKRLSLMLHATVGVRPEQILEHGGPEYPQDLNAKFGISLVDLYTRCTRIFSTQSQNIYGIFAGKV